MSWFLRLLIINIIVQSGIIVTGAIVRVTASGLGCPTWPECVDGSVIPTSDQMESWHKYVEFGNRLLTFVLAIVAIAVAISVFRKTRVFKTRLLGATPLIGTLFQAVLGGITVLTGLNPYTVMAHFIVSVILVALCTRLYWHFAYPDKKWAATWRRMFARILLFTSATVIVLGTVVTGTGPHSGDTDTLTRIPLDPRMTSWLHADVVWLFSGLLIAAWFLIRLQLIPESSRPMLIGLTAMTVIQAIVGYTQFFTNLPAALVAFHVLGAVIIWNYTLNLARHIQFDAGVRNSRP